VLIASLKRVTRLYVIESQVLFLKALCTVFADDPDLQIVGESCSISASALRAVLPDCILLDIDGSEIDLAQELALCREAAPAASVCILSMRAESEIMQRCLTAGARGFVIKNISPSELMRAVKLIVAGETFVDGRVAGEYLRRSDAGHRRLGESELSAREMEIVALIARGFANKEIGARLHLSEKTIKNYVSRVFVKLRITSRTQTAVHAIRLGLA